MKFSLNYRLLGIGLGIAAVLGFSVLAWEVLRPGPLDFAGGKTVPLADYVANPTGIPADYAGATDVVSRGKYLQEAADCEACHTVPGGARFAGGRAFVTQFGTMYAPNITADVETGIGSWTDAEFLRAMHEGVGKGGKRLYPAFPYAAYTHMTDEDVLAIKAYLFSLPPVRSAASANELRFPFNQRWLMRIWAALYNPNARYEARPERDPEWNRGAYMVEALGHCGDCHTPRTLFQSLDNRRKFQGGLAEGWRAYNISSDRGSGIGGWSDEELTRYLRTGRSETHGVAFGPMAEAVHLSTARMTPSDVRAMVKYLRSIPAVSSPDLPDVKTKPASARFTEDVPMDQNRRGRELFAAACAGCHGWTGADSRVSHATLTGVRAVNDPTATNVALAVLHGTGELPGPGGIAPMPAFGSAYSDSDIAAVSNYVTARFGARKSAISAQDVRKLREAH